MADCIITWCQGVCGACCVTSLVGVRMQPIRHYNVAMSTVTQIQMLCIMSVCCAEFVPFMQKYVPFDLRPKKTRAIRKRMTKHQVSCYFALGFLVHQNLSIVGTLLTYCRDTTNLLCCGASKSMCLRPAHDVAACTS